MGPWILSPMRLPFRHSDFFSIVSACRFALILSRTGSNRVSGFAFPSVTSTKFPVAFRYSPIPIRFALNNFAFFKINWQLTNQFYLSGIRPVRSSINYCRMLFWQMRSLENITDIDHRKSPYQQNRCIYFLWQLLAPR